MARTRYFTPIATAALFAAFAACSVHKQEAAPSLTGPSGLGTNITIQVSPDELTQDGASQSVVMITATNSNGQPVPNLSMRVDITVDGALTDFGTLSARNVVTDANGHATSVYTAPAAVAGSPDAGTMVQIQVTPSGTDFANAVASHIATIRLTPPGIIGAPASPLIPSFSPPAANAGDTAVFSATVVDAKGNDASGQVTSFAWNFGDGGTGTGQTVRHTFATAGTDIVSLTITDNLGRTAAVSKAMTVGAAATFSPTFFTNPASDLVSGESIIFNASANTPPAGHTITGYFWDFGDGSDNATGAVVNHTFASPATYNVLLRVTLDNGSQPTSQTALTINPPVPTARMSIIPATAAPGQLITFLGNQSIPAPGHQIVSYAWTFGDCPGSANNTATGSTVTHTYNNICNGATSQTFTVTLIVTDEDGNQNIATGVVTISSGD